MREIRSSGSVEGVMGNRDPYSDSPFGFSAIKNSRAGRDMTGVPFDAAQGEPWAFIYACDPVASIRSEQALGSDPIHGSTQGVESDRSGV